MDASDLLPHRTALIGAAVALAIGLTGGLILKTGSQAAPEMEAYALNTPQDTEVQPIAWPSGEVADYVVGTDFLKAQQSPSPPVVVASYEIPEYVPPAPEPDWSAPAPQAEPEPQRQAISDDRTWPSTHGDILDTRLPEDAPASREVAEAPRAPIAVAAPVAMAAAY